ncbi:MAG: DUF6076 domain-containing protein [Faecousia sp.]
MTGLYVSITPDGKIKRHLSTEHGEVPLEDTTVFGELISLSEKSYLKSVEFAEGLLSQGIRSPDQKAYKAFWKEVDSFLTEQAVSDPIDSFFTRALITDNIHNYKCPHDKPLAEHKICFYLTVPVSMQAITAALLESYRLGEALEEHLCYSIIQECKTTAVFSLEGGLHTQYVFRSHDQYYRFLLQRFIASKTTLNKCQYCGRYFVPKTKRKTLYCDRVIRNGKTCKQIAPYLNRKERAAADRVISEFNRINDMLLHRLERAEYDKKSSPIDLTRKEYYQWLDTATDARDRYLTGDLAEEEAIHMIHMPTIQELRESQTPERTPAGSCV